MVIAFGYFDLVIEHLFSSAQYEYSKCSEIWHCGGIFIDFYYIFFSISLVNTLVKWQIMTSLAPALCFTPAPLSQLLSIGVTLEGSVFIHSSFKVASGRQHVLLHFAQITLIRTSLQCNVTSHGRTHQKTSKTLKVESTVSVQL